MATSFPIEVKSDRVILVRMTANKANVLTLAFFQQLHATLDVIQKQYPTMGVVFTGNGSIFSAGLDLKFMTEARKAKKFNDMIDYIEKFESICHRMFTFPQPTVAAIEGHAIAGGTVLASACDFRISNGKGNFGMNEVINGLTLPFQMLEILRFAVPSQSSWHMFMTGEVFGAQKALALGVVKEIVSPEQLLERAVAVATYSKLSMNSFSDIKKSMQRPVVELMAKNQGVTRKEMEAIYGIKAKL